MIQKNLFKKLGAILMGVYLGFNGVEVSASLPISNPNVFAFIPEGSDFWDYFLEQMGDAETNFITISTTANVTFPDFVREYQRLVDQPL